MSGFKIEDFTPAPSANEYDDAVAALIQAGDGKSVLIENIPVADEAKARRRFGEAANRADKSARVRESVPSKDGKTVALRFTVGPRITQNRKPKDGEIDTTDAEVAADSTV